MRALLAKLRVNCIAEMILQITDPTLLLVKYSSLEVTYAKIFPDEIFLPNERVSQ